MAAGVSSRMKKSSITKEMTKNQINQSNSRVKGYIQVGEGREPLIFYLIKNSINAGVREFYIIVSNNSKDFQKYLKSHALMNGRGDLAPGLKLKKVFDQEQGNLLSNILYPTNQTFLKKYLLIIKLLASF